MSKKTNIIFFFSDQQRWDTVGCYGQKLDVTPNLDKMAEEGVRFENAFTCQPVCGPARACLQTGKYAEEIGCYRNAIALPMDEKTIAHCFKEVGYETAYIGKWHLASTDDIDKYEIKAVPYERRGGWEYWVAADVLEFTSDGYGGYMYDGNYNKREFKGYRADCTTDFALEYLENRYQGNVGDKDKPFALFISYIEPHHQNNHNRYEGPVNSKEKFKNFQVPGDLEGTEGDWRENYPDYLGSCNSLDYNLGRIREEVKKLGIEDETLIVYTSDHGTHFRTRNNEYKRSCHESSIHIPMVAYGPGFKGGKEIKELVSLIDVPPTLLKEADIEKPEYMKGRPLQEVVNGNCSDWPKEVFLQISESQVGRAIRTDK
ncbi:MAG: sulfatase-like hydrolase/transferase, partial [Clostridiaceae bacterium]